MAFLPKNVLTACPLGLQLLKWELYSAYETSDTLFEQDCCTQQCSAAGIVSTSMHNNVALAPARQSGIEHKPHIHTHWPQLLSDLETSVASLSCDV